MGLCDAMLAIAAGSQRRSRAGHKRAPFHSGAPARRGAGGAQAGAALGEQSGKERIAGGIVYRSSSVSLAQRVKG